jgi:Phosducin
VQAPQAADHKFREAYTAKIASCSSTMDPLEKAILEGGISKDDGFGPERRATGHDPEAPSSEPNTDDELGSDISHGSAGASPVDKDLAALQEAEAESMRATSSGKRGGPSTHTGPKGVINDKKVQERLDRNKRQAAVGAVNQRLQGMALSASTWDEEERLRKLEAEEKEGRGSTMQDDASQQASIEELAARERRREQRMEELKAKMMHGNGQGVKIVRGPNTWFGHLREVDARGYADAIDRTEEGTYVVVHIYSKVIR